MNLKITRVLCFRSKQQSLSNEPKYHIPAGQPDQIIFVLVEGDVMLGIDNFEGGVVGAGPGGEGRVGDDGCRGRPFHLRAADEACGRLLLLKRRGRTLKVK